MDRRVNMDGGVDGGSDAGIAMGGMPGQAGDARVKPGAASSHVRATLLPSSPLLALLDFDGDLVTTVEVL